MRCGELFTLHLCEAFAAVYRSVIAWLERNLSNSAAVSASCFKHFLCSACILLCVTASLAALWFVYETFFSIEFLFAGCEHEFCSAILAAKCLVFV